MNTKKNEAAEMLADGTKTSTGEAGAEAAGAKERVSAATLLVQLAEEKYDLGCTTEGEPYGVPKEGPRIVRQLRGGRGSLRSELSRAYYDEHRSAPSQSALADALMVLEGKAQHEATPEDLHLRVAELDDTLILDIGDSTGSCIEITHTDWTVVEQPKVLFRRTALTAPLPQPERGQQFDDLWIALNVKSEYQPLVLACLVSGLMPSIPHPVMLIGGEHGTGKTTATNRLGSVIDPSTVGPRKCPRDVEAWTTAAAGSWVVTLDNLSTIQDWLSDALCRAVTGDGDIRRRLYTDGDLAVFKFRRVLVVNGIDVGAMRGDLADRLVHLVLERIPDTSRRTDKDMGAKWRDAHPKVLGALLDLTVKVLNELPSIQLEKLPRMADFARVLAAVDTVCKTDGMATYRNLRTEQAEDIASSDPVIVEIRKVVVGETTANSAVLLDTIHPTDPTGVKVDERRLPKGWPANASALTAHLNRIAPTLRQLGWKVAKKDRTKGRLVEWELTPPSTPLDDGQRKPENDAHDAQMRDDQESSQVNASEQGRASARASAAQHHDDAQPAHPDLRCAADAQPMRTTHEPLTSRNKHHRALAHQAHPNRPSSASGGHRERRPVRRRHSRAPRPQLPRARSPAETASITDLTDRHINRRSNVHRREYRD